jgi:hypothetical protein
MYILRGDDGTGITEEAYCTEDDAEEARVELVRLYCAAMLEQAYKNRSEDLKHRPRERQAFIRSAPANGKYTAWLRETPEAELIALMHACASGGGCVYVPRWTIHEENLCKSDPFEDRLVPVMHALPEASVLGFG